jgi:hypothetical protein
MLIEATQRARAELHRLRSESGASEQEGIRVDPETDGRLGLTIDAVKPDDVVMSDDGAPLLITDRRAAARLDGTVLHYRGIGDDRYGPNGFVLLRKRRDTDAAAA